MKLEVLLFIVFSAFGFVLTTNAQEAAKGHPLISSYPGMVIVENYSDFYEYESLSFATQPALDENQPNSILAVGALTHTQYQSEDTANISPLKVLKNYVNELKRSEFDILLECTNEQCGSSRFLYDLHSQSPLWNYFQSFEPGVYISFSYVSASKVVDDQTIYVSLIIYRYGTGQTLVVQDVLETEALEDGLIEVNLDFNDISTQGRIVLNGLLFETGQAALLDASNQSLEEIAAFLINNPEREFYVVGHTDNEGSHELNMDLSKRRAETVLVALRDQFGVKQKQLLAIGNGATSPIATNVGETGRAKNRRVELVER